MVFQLLEDLTEMSTIKDCKDIFGYIESQQDVLGKVTVILILFGQFCQVQKMHVSIFADGTLVWLFIARTFWTWKTSYAKDL